MRSVLHVITGLGVGGAEMMLVKLVSELARRKYTSCVISLKGKPGGPIYQKLHELGIPVFCLDVTRPFSLPLRLYQLINFIRRSQPTVLQSWMYHGDFVGSFIGLIFRIPVIWNLRQSNLAKSHTKQTTLMLISVLARMSRRWPRRIICGSHAAKRVHVAKGYDEKKMIVIPNGFDLRQLNPPEDKIISLKRQLCLEKDTMVIGIVGRFDPQKDYLNFIRASSIVLQRFPQVKLVMCGTDISAENKILYEWLKQFDLLEKAILLGERNDIPVVMGMFTILVSSSLGEGFPNVIGEGMAAGLPCVVTNVGDSAYLVDDTGKVVPPKDPESLAEAIIEMIALPKELLEKKGLAGQKRIRECFSISAVTKKYLDLYDELVQIPRKKQLG